MITCEIYTLNPHVLFQNTKRKIDEEVYAKWDFWSNYLYEIKLNSLPQPAERKITVLY